MVRLNIEFFLDTHRWLKNDILHCICMQSHFIKDSNLHCTEGSHIALLPTPKFLLDEKFWLIQIIVALDFHVP